MITYRAFSTYGRPLEMVTSFKYLRKAILAADNYWPAVLRNLANAQAMWRRLTRIISKEGAAP